MPFREQLAAGPIIIKYGTLIRVPGPRWDRVEESLAAVEVVRESGGYIAKVQSDLGGVREYRGVTFEQVLEQVIIDLQEEFEEIPV